jgi:hypothetical protein
MKLKSWFAAGFVLVSFLCASDARAMAILEFARMNLDDQATYVAALVEGSAKMLRADGHPDQAQKVIDLFKNSTKQGGVNQLAMKLKELHAENDHNAINPNNRAHVYDVEDAMAATLHENGIEVPVKYLETINRNFAPAYPFRSHTGGP